ncbi:methyl-accepting chemotaxis protein [Nitrobacteraceae bacterium AZCC 2161]
MPPTLSIRFKMIAAISSLLVMLACTGMLAIVQMEKMNDNTVEITTHWLRSVRMLGQVQSELNGYRAAVRGLLLETNPQKRADAEKSFNKALRDFEESFKAYKALVTSPEERALADEFGALWNVGMPIALEAVEVSRNDPNRAAEIFAKTAPNGPKLLSILQKSFEFNNNGADSATRYAADRYRFAFLIIGGILSIAMVLGIGGGLYMVSGIVRGIGSIITPMRALGEGDLTAIVPHRGEKTEIGQMANTLQIFKDALIAKKVADEAAAAEADAKIARAQRVDNITRRFESTIGELVGSLSSSSTELEAAAHTLTKTAENTQGLSTLVAAASEEASTNVQSVASASEQMASSVNEIGRQVQESARIAGAAVEQAQKTNDRVNALSQAATRIGDVVDLINTIAGQTNLLALNATIEAARAGEAGRGFAVVASEVKALAEQTAKATGEISHQIAGIQAATQDSVAAIQEISGTIGRISEISSTIASAVEEQGAATQEISRNVQQAAQGTQQVASNITDVQRGASETGSASSQVLASAQTLSNDSARLKTEVGEFLSTVRAA